MINFSFYSINSVIFQSLYLFYGVNQSNKKGFLVKVAFRGHTSLYKINSRLSLRRYLHHQSRLILQHPTMVFFSIYIFSHSYSYWSVPKFWIWCTFFGTYIHGESLAIFTTPYISYIWFPVKEKFLNLISFIKFS